MQSWKQGCIFLFENLYGWWYNFTKNVSGKDRRGYDYKRTGSSYEVRQF